MCLGSLRTNLTTWIKLNITTSKSLNGLSVGAKIAVVDTDQAEIQRWPLMRCLNCERRGLLLWIGCANDIYIVNCGIRISEVIAR